MTSSAPDLPPVESHSQCVCPPGFVSCAHRSFSVQQPIPRTDGKLRWLRQWVQHSVDLAPADGMVVAYNVPEQGVRCVAEGFQPTVFSRQCSVSHRSSGLLLPTEGSGTYCPSRWSTSNSSMPIVRQDALQEHVLHGQRIRLQCSSPTLLLRGRTILEYHGALLADTDGGHDDRTTTITINRTEIPIPRAAREVTHHETGLSILRHGSHTYLTRGRAVARLDYAEPRVDIALPDAKITPAEAYVDLYLLLTFVVLLLLQHRNLFAVHAAALRRTKESHGVLIIAESDSGKSTLTMNLIRQGWHFLSDDSVVLRLQQKGGARRVETRSLRRDFALDPDAADLFPDLPKYSEPLFTDPNKWRVAIDEMFPGQRAKHCIPKVLLFPMLVERGESEFIPLKPREALLQLMNQSSFLAATPEVASQHLEVLRTLVEQACSYRLLAGNDIKNDGTALKNLFASL